MEVFSPRRRVAAAAVPDVHEKPSRGTDRPPNLGRAGSWPRPNSVAPGADPGECAPEYPGRPFFPPGRSRCGAPAQSGESGSRAVLRLRSPGVGRPPCSAPAQSGGSRADGSPPAAGKSHRTPNAAARDRERSPFPEGVCPRPTPRLTPQLVVTGKSQRGKGPRREMPQRVLSSENLPFLV